jgi:hypothetical protein
MQIGCKTFTHDEWAAFDDETIASFDPKASYFWHKNKPVLLTLCENHNEN